MVDSRPQVSIVRATSLLSDLNRCLDALGGVGRFAPPGRRVLIKPNFGVPRPPATAAITDPDLVMALAEVFLAKGARVTIGESCVTGFQLADIFDQVGIGGRAQALGVELVDLRADQPVEIAIPDAMVLPRVRVARTALSADLVVNVPKMKTHVETTVTLAVKNMKGILTGNEKARLHQIDAPIDNALEAAISDLNGVLPPTLNVIDGILAMEGGGPIEGEPVEMGVLIAGDNRVAVDTVACDVMEIDPKTVRHLSLCAARGHGPLAVDALDLAGDPIGPLRRPFLQAQAVDFSIPCVDLVEAGACSACAGGIRQALRGMADRPEVAEANRVVRVSVGSLVPVGYAPEDIAIGNCAIRRQRGAQAVPGCPPLFGKMRVAMLRALQGRSVADELVQDGDRHL